MDLFRLRSVDTIAEELFSDPRVHLSLKFQSGVLSGRRFKRITWHVIFPVKDRVITDSDHSVEFSEELFWSG